MDDKFRVLCGPHHVLPVHGIASHALHTVRRSSLCRLTCHRPHPPAALQQHLRNLAADTAIRPDDQGQWRGILSRICLVFIYHRRTPCYGLEYRPVPRYTKLSKSVERLYKIL